MKLLSASLSTAVFLHEVLAPLQHEAIEPQPHIDFENNFPECKRAIAGVTSGGSSGMGELPGHFRRRTLYAKSLRVKKTQNRREKIETLDAFVDTARELANAFPGLKPWERQMHFQMFQSEVRMTLLRTRGCKDFSAALPLVARQLRLPA
jgi:hypothetical protein